MCLENLYTNRYITISNTSLRQVMLNNMDNEVDLFYVTAPSTIPELRAKGIGSATSRVEIFKILSHPYALRWLIWDGIDCYSAFMWNSGDELIIQKLS